MYCERECVARRLLAIPRLATFLTSVSAHEWRKYDHGRHLTAIRAKTRAGNI